MDRSCNATILEKVIEYLQKHAEFDKTGSSQEDKDTWDKKYVEVEDVERTAICLKPQRKDREGYSYLRQERLIDPEDDPTGTLTRQRRAIVSKGDQETNDEDYSMRTCLRAAQAHTKSIMFGKLTCLIPMRTRKARL